MEPPPLPDLPPEEPLLVELVPESVGRPVVAWIVILSAVGFVATVNLLSPRGAAAVGGEDRLGLIVMKMQARYIIGFADLFGRTNPSFASQAEGLDNGPPEKRLRYVVLVGELSGPDAALKQINKLNGDLKAQGTAFTPEQRMERNLLRRLYRDHSGGRWTAPSLTEEDRQLLRTELGWFGELALTPASGEDAAAREAVLAPARMTAVVWMLVLVVLGLVGIGGLVGLVLLVSFLCAGRLPGGIRRRSDHGGVYAETFAVWMVLFLCLSLGSTWLPAVAPKLVLVGIAMLLSLVALGWPVGRGVPWRDVRREVGLTMDRPVVLGPILGLACYAMALPLLVIGAIIMLLLMRLPFALADAGGGAGPKSLPVHPIIEYLAAPGWEIKLQVLFVASLVAPIVEETMFRGVLYRHLRDVTGWVGRAGSALVSAVIVSFLFAVIHPQGLLGVPPLMGLALAFALVREWRGSLVPAMVAHGFNNALLVLLGSMALGG